MTGKAKFSALISVIGGLIAYLVLQFLDISDALTLAFLSGLLFFLLLYPYLVLHEKRMNRKYAEVETNISSPIFYKTNGNFNLGNSKVKNGNIYFCDDRIVCICVEKKPYLIDEILFQNIDHFGLGPGKLFIFTTDEKIYIIAIPNEKELVDLLISKDWMLPG